MKCFLMAAVALGTVQAAAPAIAGDPGLYGERAHHAPRRGGPNEDSFVVEQDDRAVVACYDATYYPARYRVDPQGQRVSGAGREWSVTGDRYVVTRKPAIYIETRTRIKEDYVSLRRVGC